MLGAICGDIIGSVYEWNNVKTKDFKFFGEGTQFTDDSVMTIAKASKAYKENKDLDKFQFNCIYYMQLFGNKYPYAGYGGHFKMWLGELHPQPYNSYGNGSAMRVSPVAWVADSLEEAEQLAEISAGVSHNHIEGIKGAQAVAAAIWMLRNGSSKEDVLKYIKERFYDIDFKLDDIRDAYQFDVSCQGSVPHAIEAFMESESFEDAIRNAISIGGDSDTIAAITGSMAEAYYGIDESIKEQAISYLPKDLREVVEEFEKVIEK